MKNKVWYYQSGPKSVSINPYGIPEPPKPVRNCQSLDWPQKTKKFESLKKEWRRKSYESMDRVTDGLRNWVSKNWVSKNWISKNWNSKNWKSTNEFIVGS